MYLNHFKLREDPFSLTPSTSLYCKIPQYEETLKTIRFALQQREGFFLVTADIGLGKTFIARKLMSLLKNTHQCHICYIYNPCVSTESLEKMIALELGADIADNKNVYQSIHERLLFLSGSGKRIILVLDESQTMSDENLEFIRLLTNLETEKSKLIQVIMFGQLELTIRLQQHHLKQLKQRIVYHRQLRPLTLPECSYYLKRRISLSGGNPDVILPLCTRKKIWILTKGNPREINILSKRALLCAFARNSILVNKRDANLAYKEVQLGWKCQQTIKSLTVYRFNVLAFVFFCILLILVIFFFERYA